jgi:hypothetical protein
MFQAIPTVARPPRLYYSKSTGLTVGTNLELVPGQQNATVTLWTLVFDNPTGASATVTFLDDTLAEFLRVVMVNAETIVVPFGGLALPPGSGVIATSNMTGLYHINFGYDQG